VDMGSDVAKWSQIDVLAAYTLMKWVTDTSVKLILETIEI
jgi:hypothetical protein